MTVGAVKGAQAQAGSSTLPTLEVTTSMAQAGHSVLSALAKKMLQIPELGDEGSLHGHALLVPGRGCDCKSYTIFMLLSPVIWNLLGAPRRCLRIKWVI